MTDGRQYALLSYSGTGNLGDEVQSIAASRFLPRIDHYIDREHLDAFALADGRPAKLIMNGWFCSAPKNWPPSRDIDPLLISFHITEWPGLGSGRSAREVFAQPAVQAYLRRQQPVGARDLHTLDLLRSWGLESYFSGCLTLTLERPPLARDHALIVFCDVPADVSAALQRSAPAPARAITHKDKGTPGIEPRFARAKERLDLYAQASCVVTTRLHCALPCLAFGTPVLLLDTAPDQYRFAGLSDLLHHFTPDELLSGRKAYDIASPPPNPTLHHSLREELIQATRAFVAG